MSWALASTSASAARGGRRRCGAGRRPWSRRSASRAVPPPGGRCGRGSHVSGHVVHARILAWVDADSETRRDADRRVTDVPRVGRRSLRPSAADLRRSACRRPASPSRPGAGRRQTSLLRRSPTSSPARSCTYAFDVAVDRSVPARAARSLPPGRPRRRSSSVARLVLDLAVVPQLGHAAAPGRPARGTVTSRSARCTVSETDTVAGTRLTPSILALRALCSATGTPDRSSLRPGVRSVDGAEVGVRDELPVAAAPDDLVPHGSGMPHLDRRRG